MFLSDQLIEIGSQANPKSNLSQGEAAKDMHFLIVEAHKEGKSVDNLVSITKFAIKALIKLGFTYYTIQIFFLKKTKGHYMLHK